MRRQLLVAAMLVMTCVLGGCQYTLAQPDVSEAMAAATAAASTGRALTVEEYAEVMGGYAVQLPLAVPELERLLRRSDFGNLGWEMLIGMGAERLYGLRDQVVAIDPALVPDEMREAHALYVTAFQEYGDAMDHALSGIGHLDKDELAVARDEMRSAKERLKEAQRLTEEYLTRD